MYLFSVCKHDDPVRCDFSAHTVDQQLIAGIDLSPLHCQCKSIFLSRLLLNY